MIKIFLALKTQFIKHIAIKIFIFRFPQWSFNQMLNFPEKIYLLKGVYNIEINLNTVINSIHNLKILKWAHDQYLNLGFNIGPHLEDLFIIAIESGNLKVIIWFYTKYTNLIENTDIIYYALYSVTISKWLYKQFKAKKIEKELFCKNNIMYLAGCKNNLAFLKWLYKKHKKHGDKTILLENLIIAYKGVINSEILEWLYKKLIKSDIKYRLPALTANKFHNFVNSDNVYMLNWTYSKLLKLGNAQIIFDNNCAFFRDSIIYGITAVINWFCDLFMEIGEEKRIIMSGALKLIIKGIRLEAFEKMFSFYVNHKHKILENHFEPFRIAAKKGFLTIMKRFYSLHKEITAANHYAFRFAAKYGHLSVLEWLYKKYAKLNISLPDYIYNLSLHWARKFRHTETEKFLLEIKK